MTTQTEHGNRPTSGLGTAEARPWLEWYDAGVTPTVVIPDLPLPHFIATNAMRFPTRPAIRFQGRVITYRDLDEGVNRFANALGNLGIRKGDRVALLMPNCPQMVIAYYGTLRAGAVVVSTSPLLSPRELRQVWTEAGARVAVCLSPFYRQVQGIRNELPALEHVVVTNIKEYLPPIIRMLFILTQERKGDHRPSIARDGRTHWLQPLLAAASPCSPQVPSQGDDLALLQPTGGTTGLPKLAMLTHRSLLANALQVADWFTPLARPDRADIVLGVVPAFHIYGMTTVLNYCTLSGATMILQPRFVTKDVLRAIDHEKVAFFPGVPPMYAAINRVPGAQRYNFDSLKLAISGAAALPESVQSTFEELTGAKLVEGYGLTEASPVTHCGPLLGRRKVGSIGIPLPNTDAAIFDQETGTRLLAIGEIGELAVRGPQVMRGYWQQAEETAQVLKDGWLFTGDLARVDADGFFYVVDRKKDLINSGGMKVYPREVEETLQQHPKVQDVVAVSIPDEKWGEAVKVFIVPKKGEAATIEEIIAFSKDRMAHYKVPKYVEFRSELPKSLIGKVLRRQLLQEECAHRADHPSRPSP